LGVKDATETPPQLATVAVNVDFAALSPASVALLVVPPARRLAAAAVAPQ